MTNRRYEYEVTADDSGFKSAMDRVGREAQNAGRDVERSFSRAERQFQSLEGVAANLRTVFAGALSVGAVVQFGRAIAREALDAEREVGLLNATLRSTGFAAGLSVKDVQALANELSRVSSLDSGDILQGTTALLRFREISGDTFREASRLAVDLSVATGRDLPAAFTAVGRALQDPVNGIRGLREVGVQLSEGQAELAGKLLETGRTADAQRLILDELTKSVGGAAGVGGTGLTGATNNLSNAWKDLLQNIGQTATVSGAAKGSLDGLTRGLNFANRLLAQQENPLGGSINVPGVTPPATIGRLSESEALALQNLPGPRTKIGEPKAADPKAAAEAKRRAAEERARREAEFQEALRFGKALSDAEIRQLEAAADDKVRVEQELAKDRERILQEGPAAAEKQQKEYEQRINALLGGSRGGQQNALLKDISLVNKAFDEGRISAEQLDSVYASLRRRAEDIDREGSKAFDNMGDAGVKALQRLQFAVEGWGRQFTETLATAIESGKLQFSDLVRSVLRDLLRLQIQRSITEPLFGALSGALGSRVPTASAAGTPFGMSFGGSRDSGGPGVPGTAYLIGTGAQPEAFVPSTSGTFVPRAKFGGTTIINNNYIDSRSDITSVRQAILSASSLSQAEMARANRRG